MQGHNPRKLALARAFRAAGIDALLLRAQAWLLGPHVRALNYHDVPPSRAAEFEAQLRFYAARFQPVGPAELAALLAGNWGHDRPGLLLSFDDGLRSHAEVVAPLLERHGFPGWFFAPTGFVDAPVEEQADFAERGSIQLSPDELPDSRAAMTWEQLRALDGRGHVIGCHTVHHRRLSAELGPAELHTEIVSAKARLEEGLGHAIEAMAWVGGEDWAYSAPAAELIRGCGFRFAFMTNNAVARPGSDPLQIQRTNVEADYPEALLRFQLSGFLDATYTAKRRRVNRRTAAAA